MKMIVRQFGYLLLAVVLLATFQPVRNTWWHLGLSGSYLPTIEEQEQQNNQQQEYIDVPQSPQTTLSCSDINYLMPKQKELCENDKKLLFVITKGAAVGINECQHQFKSRRWNCSVFNQTNIFGNVLNAMSRETAYIYSIFSAGIMHSVTKACSRGDLTSCKCDMKPKLRERYRGQQQDDGNVKGEFEWGGCSDSIKYSNRFAKAFVDSNELRTKAQGLMNLWNNGAGRRAVRTHLKLACKCHGVSGSCAKKICWHKLLPFREVGSLLKTKFDSAMKVKMHKKKHKLKRINKKYKSPSRKDLVYLRESPDFCEANQKAGILGTRRRLCNKTSPGLDGCTLMCCGRGYYTLVQKNKQDCDCKFIWCCTVECKKCNIRQERHYCN